ncbi:MAG: DUF6876 family protein, partial [Pirellulaceae bacterium]
IATPKKTLAHEDLSQFSGDTVRYRHGINRRVIYTPGVRFLAEQGGSYWLIDVIASYLTPKFIENASRTDDRIRDLHLWRLDVAPDRSALVTARADTDCPPFVSQEIPFTDFPLQSVSVWAGCDGRLWTLYLPSEH